MTSIERLQEQVASLQSEVTQNKQDFESKIARLETEVTQNRQDFDDAMNNWEQSEKRVIVLEEENKTQNKRLTRMEKHVEKLTGCLITSYKSIENYLLENGKYRSVFTTAARSVVDFFPEIKATNSINFED